MSSVFILPLKCLSQAFHSIFSLKVLFTGSGPGHLTNTLLQYDSGTPKESHYKSNNFNEVGESLGFILKVTFLLGKRVIANELNPHTAEQINPDSYKSSLQLST